MEVKKKKARQPMNKTEIRRILQEKRNELESLLRSKVISRFTALKGTINFKTQNGAIRFFRYEKRKCKYLKKEDKKEITDLCTKHYVTRLKDAASKELEQINSCLEILDDGDSSDVDKTYGELPDCIKENTSPSIFTDEGYARRWQEESFNTKWDMKNRIHETPGGDKVRSKSEWMIACLLTQAGIPYRYEAELDLDLGFYIYPDFTVLNKRTRKEYIWEHFGKMDDPKYVKESFMPKMRDYYAAGYLPGEKLLMTFESEGHPFNITQAKQLIKQFLT